MATFEQIKQKLTETIKTTDDLARFRDKWGGDYIIQTVNDEAIPKMIHRIVTDAMDEGNSDKLGLQLGFPSDQQTALTRMAAAHRYSLYALCLSGVAILISGFALLKNW